MRKRDLIFCVGWSDCAGGGFYFDANFSIGGCGWSWAGLVRDSGGGSCCSIPLGGLALNLAISYLCIQPSGETWYSAIISKQTGEISQVQVDGLGLNLAIFIPMFWRRPFDRTVIQHWQWSCQLLLFGTEICWRLLKVFFFPISKLVWNRAMPNRKNRVTWQSNNLIEWWVTESHAKAFLRTSRGQKVVASWRTKDCDICEDKRLCHPWDEKMEQDDQLLAQEIRAHYFPGGDYNILS